MNKRYISIAKKIRERIDAGTYAPGDPIPTRMELSRSFGVARATIDRCIEFLISNGTLVSRQGSGTYVNSKFTDSRKIIIVGHPGMPVEPPLMPMQVSYINFSQIKDKSERAALLKYDGILWFRPDEPSISWLDEFQGKVPQVVVNRILDGFQCVSTDHRGAFREITLERLEALPDAAPYFLRVSSHTIVSKYREDGFVDACREKGRFYEVLSMPDKVEDKLKTLDDHLGKITGRPLLLVSDSLSNTGSVMIWARKMNLEWKKDIFYSDFDNDMPDHIWGTMVTSYIQNDKLVLSNAIDKLLALISGRDPGPEHILIFPKRRPGDT